MGPLATSHNITVDVTGGPQCGYVCIAGEVDLAGRKTSQKRYAQLTALYSRTVVHQSRLGHLWRVQLMAADCYARRGECRPGRGEPGRPQNPGVRMRRNAG
jgi:hypothetical protein